MVKICDGAWKSDINKTTETERAPAIAPIVPEKLTPPSVPGSTDVKFVIFFVFPALRIPISVAQVSAAAAAIAVKAAIRKLSSVKRKYNMQNMHTQKPFAQTW